MKHPVGLSLLYPLISFIIGSTITCVVYCSLHLLCVKPLPVVWTVTVQHDITQILSLKIRVTVVDFSPTKCFPTSCGGVKISVCRVIGVTEYLILYSNWDVINKV